MTSKSSKMDEIVIAVPTGKLFSSQSPFQGFIPCQLHNEIAIGIFDAIMKYGAPRRRGDCENDPSWKHIIPYVNFFVPTTKTIFVTRRTENQTEARLHGKASIGIGGHVGPQMNLSILDAISHGMKREIEEELDINWASLAYPQPYFSGFVNWDKTEVGTVHFGLVWTYRIHDWTCDEIKIRETENMTGEWMALEDALKIENYEDWSELILANYAGQNLFKKAA